MRIFPIFLLIPLFFLGLFASSIALPDKDNPICLYTTTYHDLEPAFMQALASAKNSIELSSFNFTSDKAIALLNKKADSGVYISVFYDSKASRRLAQKLHPAIKKYPWKGKGLMHRKSAIIDGKIVLIGSANFSWSSLNQHRNLLFAVKDPLLAKKLSHHTLFQNRIDYLKASRPISGRHFTLYSLPQEGKEAEQALLSQISTAKKTIQVAMYTWTREDFAKKIVEAHNRGVQVEVLLDSGIIEKIPAAKKVWRLLQKEKVPAYRYRGEGFLHHKFALFDGHRLLTGSANWTKQGFNENWEYIIDIPLNKQHEQTIQSVWKRIKSHCK